MSGTLNLMSVSGAGGTLRPPTRVSVRAFTATAVAVDSRRPANLYEVLRIKQNASAVEIKLAYRNLAKVYHPDSVVRRSESDERDFIEIHDAYETLSDPSARALYDLSLMAARSGSRSFSSLVTQSRSSRFCQTRKWETDQCW
ncbi:Chaperone protein dnaJ 11, chloroplastic, partial [Mucuna pruriens]